MRKARQPSATAFPIPDQPILVVGDIMCDHYVWGDVDRISPEAPVQVLKWKREADRPGGAANAAMNLAALGCRVHLAGVIGRDEPGRWLTRTLKAAGVDVSGVVQAADRATTLKTRVIARGQHMLRIDRETRAEITPQHQRRLVAAIRRLRSRVAGVVCSDYAKGVLTARVLTAALGGRRSLITVVDPKGLDFERYRGASVLTPNEKELMEAVPDGDPRVADDDVVRRRAERLLRRLQLRAVLVTRGARGMDLFEQTPRSVHHVHIPASQRHEVFDVTGAGDTVAAVLAMTASTGLPLAEAARVANAAAGIVVGMVGTAVADPETLSGVVGGAASQARSKVLTRRGLLARVREARAHGATIVFTSGDFANLTIDDLRALQDARAQGDLLVVGVGGETSGGGIRAEMLAALRVVDYVIVVTEQTRARLLQDLRPDIIA